MASVFKKDEVVAQEKSVIEIIRDSLDVDATGVVRFRSRIGRGSGKAVEIPGGEFDEFVTLMVQTRESREALAEQEYTLREATAEANAKEETENNDSDESDEEGEEEDV